MRYAKTLNRSQKRQAVFDVFRWRFGIFRVLAVCVSTGCVAVPFYGRTPRAALPATDALLRGLHDYTGVIHVHTAPYSSDASGTLQKAIRVARRQQLDYLLITEHNATRGYERGRERWYGQTLVLSGEEISTRDGHYLALNIAHHVSRHQPTRRVIEQVAAQGGLGFVAHPFWRKQRWRRWDAPDIAGMEIYNVAADATEESRLRLMLWALLLPPEAMYLSVVDRPSEALRLWDDLTQRRRFVGIGGADAHEIRVLWMTIGPYEMLFRMVRTHVIAPTLTPETLYAALRDGHAYIGLETEHNATGFMFLARRGDQRLGLMGDELVWQSGLELVIIMPEPARINLLRDGRVVATSAERIFVYPADQPGVYRVEVERDHRPWIFSNPIYLRPPREVPGER